MNLKCSYNVCIFYNKECFIIDQQIARQFVLLKVHQIDPLFFYATQIIHSFLKSKISSKHDKGQVFLPIIKNFYPFMFLQYRISFSLTHNAALRILYYLVLVKVREIYIKRKLHCKPDYIINQIANTVTDKTRTKVVHRTVIQECNKAVNITVKITILFKHHAMKNLRLYYVSIHTNF